MARFVEGTAVSHSGRNSDLALYQSNQEEGSARRRRTSQQSRPRCTESDRVSICTEAEHDGIHYDARARSC